MGSWSDFLLGRGALKKAASTGDAPKPAASAPEPVPGYVESEIAKQQTQPSAVPSAKKRQPKIGFPPKKAADDSD